MSPFFSRFLLLASLVLVAGRGFSILAEDSPESKAESVEKEAKNKSDGRELRSRRETGLGKEAEAIGLPLRFLGGDESGQTEAGKEDASLAEESPAQIPPAQTKANPVENAPAEAGAADKEAVSAKKTPAGEEKEERKTVAEERQAESSGASVSRGRKGRGFMNFFKKLFSSKKAEKPDESVVSPGEGAGVRDPRIRRISRRHRDEKSLEKSGFVMAASGPAAPAEEVKEAEKKAEKLTPSSAIPVETEKGAQPGPEAAADPEPPEAKPDKKQRSSAFVRKPPLKEPFVLGGNAELTVEVYDAVSREELPASIKLSTPTGATMAGEAACGAFWQGKKRIYELPKGVIEVEADAGRDFLREKIPVKLENASQHAEIRMNRWIDSSKTGWAPFQLYTVVDPGSFSGELNTELLCVIQEAAGIHGWGLESPVKLRPLMRGPAAELKYDAFWEMTQDFHGPRRAWFTVQRFLVGGASLDVIGAYRRIQADSGLSDAENLIRIALEGRSLGGVVSLFRPSAKLRLMDSRVRAGAIAFFAGPFVDMMDLQCVEDEEIWTEVLESGLRMPAIRSKRVILGRDMPEANHLVKAEGALSQWEFLEQLRQGRILAGRDGNLSFALNARNGKSYGVGDVVPLEDPESKLTPSMGFSVRPEPGRKIRSLALLVRGKEVQPTGTVAPLNSGKAQFGDIQFKDGDWVAGRLVCEDGAKLDTNPVYLGQSWKKNGRSGGWVKLRLKLVDSRLNLIPEVKLFVRSLGYYLERVAKDGEVELEVPASAEISIEAEGFATFSYGVLHRILSRFVAEAPAGRDRSSRNEIADLSKLARYFSDIVYLEEAKTARP